MAEGECTPRARFQAQDPGEDNGIAYHFIDGSEFQLIKAEHAFIEMTVSSGHFYGTSKWAITDQFAQGKTVIVEIDMDGVQQLKADKHISARYTFIAPPSIEILELCFQGRETESEAKTAARLAQAWLELEELSLPELTIRSS